MNSFSTDELAGGKSSSVAAGRQIKLIDASDILNGVKTWISAMSFIHHGGLKLGCMMIREATRTCFASRKTFEPASIKIPDACICWTTLAVVKIQDGEMSIPVKAYVWL